MELRRSASVDVIEGRAYMRRAAMAQASRLAEGRAGGGCEAGFDRRRALNHFPRPATSGGITPDSLLSEGAEGRFRMKVVIVESPTKVKTIGKYLGKDYDVYASFGHVRDLAAKDGSVDPDDDFAMRWEVDAKAAKRLSDIARAVKGADQVILATDPDREGRGDLLARLRNPQSQEGPQGQARRPRRLQRRHQGRGRRGDAPSPRDRRGAGRRLSRPPRPRLSRRLQPLAGALA